MVNESVFDTNVLEELDTDKVVVPQGVSGELENRKVNDGIVDDVDNVSVEKTSECVNDNIEADIKKAVKRGGRRQKVVKNLKEATQQRSEKNRQEFLRRAYEALPGNTKSKSWQGQVQGAKTDCQVLKLGEEKGKLFTNDKSILQSCKDRKDLKCESFS